MGDSDRVLALGPGHLHSNPRSAVPTCGTLRSYLNSWCLGFLPAKWNSRRVVVNLNETRQVKHLEHGGGVVHHVRYAGPMVSYNFTVPRTSNVSETLA